MSAPRPLLALILACALPACGGRMIATPDAGGGGGTDAGARDGGTPVADAGRRDAGTPRDAGPPDAGPPPCACPTLPTTCTPPPANVPTFTPEAEDMAGQLFDLIACADDTLEIAAYEGNYPCVVEAINARLAQDTDLTVTIVVDNEDCAPGECIAEMLTPSARVTVVRDSRIANLMHHKFVIADGTRAWVSSANYSQRSFCTDHNNALILDQAEIVAALRTEFTRMAGGAFGPLEGDPAMPVTAGLYTLYLSPISPAGDPSPWFAAMLTAIGDAMDSIEVMTNAWTRAEIANALAEASDRGVAVRALVSSSYASDMPAQILAMEGIPIRRGNIHDKVMIIDEETVITGSANWSMNAWSNNENQLWIEDATIAATYRAEFDAAFATATPVVFMP